MNIVFLAANVIAVLALIYVLVLSRRTIRVLEGRLSPKQARRLAAAKAANERRRATKSTKVPA